MSFEAVGGKGSGISTVSQSLYMWKTVLTCSGYLRPGSGTDNHSLLM